MLGSVYCMDFSLDITTKFGIFCNKCRIHETVVMAVIHSLWRFQYLTWRHGYAGSLTGPDVRRWPAPRARRSSAHAIRTGVTALPWASQQQRQRWYSVLQQQRLHYYCIINSLCHSQNFTQWFLGRIVNFVQCFYQIWVFYRGVWRDEGGEGPPNVQVFTMWWTNVVVSTRWPYCSRKTRLIPFHQSDERTFENIWTWPLCLF